MNLVFALLLHVVTPQLAAPLQMGYHFDRDTVTVGDHVTLVLRVLAPHGSKIEFPVGPDTAHTAGSYPMEIIGKRVTAMQGDTAVAAYRLSVWDVGTQLVNMPDIVVAFGGRTQKVSLAGVSVFVRSVLPSDTTLRKPKPARPLITVFTFDWKKWLIPLLLLLLALVGLWLWWRHRRRAAEPLDPYERAKLEFARVERELPAATRPAQHFAAMVDVMRDYLAARMPGVRRSFTTRELLACLQLISPAEQELPRLLDRADFVKFARQPANADEARAAGATAKSIVDQVEARIVEAERADEGDKKLERAA